MSVNEKDKKTSWFQIPQINPMNIEWNSLDSSKKKKNLCSETANSVDLATVSVLNSSLRKEWTLGQQWARMGAAVRNRTKINKGQIVSHRLQWQFYKLAWVVIHITICSQGCTYSTIGFQGPKVWFCMSLWITLSSLPFYSKYPIMSMVQYVLKYIP